MQLREASRSSRRRREWLSGGAVASAARTTSLLHPLPGLDVPQCLPDQLGVQPTRVTTLPNGVRVASEDLPVLDTICSSAVLCCCCAAAAMRLTLCEGFWRRARRRA